MATIMMVIHAPEIDFDEDIDSKAEFDDTMISLDIDLKNAVSTELTTDNVTVQQHLFHNRDWNAVIEWAEKERHDTTNRESPV